MPACHSCPVLASVEMARDGVRWQCFPYFTNNLFVKARHSRAKIWSKPSVECCAYPARVLYVHFALAFFLSIFTSHSSCFGLSKIRSFFIAAAAGTCGRFCVSKRSPVHPSTCRVACSARNLGAGCESHTLTLQHAVDVEIFECAPEFLRSLNSGSCPLDGRSLVWKSQQVGRPWLTRA